ncbi:MAG: hypothetical protein MUO26_07410 [Methanotrichaceae archaeon]|nr:hypothetical protein [Methanotrichaceae archaeon]
MSRIESMQSGHTAPGMLHASLPSPSKTISSSRRNLSGHPHPTQFNSLVAVYKSLTAYF